MKRLLPLFAILLAACLLFGCHPKQTPAAAASAAPTAKPTAEPTVEPTAAPTEAPVPGPIVEYDAKYRKLTVTGTGDYDLLQLPEGADEAVTLSVNDDDFTLSQWIPHLPLGDEPFSVFLPGFLSRTEQSFRFLRAYLSENCDGLYPAERAALPVSLKTSNYDFGYRVRDGRLELTDTDSCDYYHREWLYLLAMMDSRSIGWEQYGYAWYVGTCLDPYSESPRMFLASSPVFGEWPYKDILQCANVNTETPTAANVRAFCDAVSRFCFELDLTGWGSACESCPVTVETFYARADAEAKLQDETLSAFMAASLIGWLDKQYGPQTIAAFCFGQKTFEEAFGTDFDAAFAAWKAWIIETYPID